MKSPLVPALIFCGLLLHGQTPRKPAGLTLVDNPVLIPDESGNATTLLHVRNDGPPTRLALSVSDFEHLRQAVDSAASKSYALGTTAILTGFSQEDQKTLDAGALDGGRTVAVKLAVSHLWEAGASKARVYNSGLSIAGPDGAEASVRAVRVPAAYNVQIVTAGEPPEIHFRGNLGQVQLRNLDAMNYSFSWSLEVDDVTRGGLVELPANSVTTLDLVAAAPSVSWASGLLREIRKDGSLILQPAFADVHQPAPSKTFPVKVRVSWASPDFSPHYGKKPLFMA